MLGKPPRELFQGKTHAVRYCLKAPSTHMVPISRIRTGVIEVEDEERYTNPHHPNDGSNLTAIESRSNASH